MASCRQRFVLQDGCFLLELKCDFEYQLYIVGLHPGQVTPTTLKIVQIASLLRMQGLWSEFGSVAWLT